MLSVSVSVKLSACLMFVAQVDRYAKSNKKNLLLSKVEGWSYHQHLQFLYISRCRRYAYR